MYVNTEPYIYARTYAHTHINSVETRHTQSFEFANVASHGH